jgi:nucleoside recognition membrane protein YjiH
VTVVNAFFETCLTTVVVMGVIMFVMANLARVFRELRR